jgi:uncharacterized protein YutE (UPF0331/DUF86 family)
MSMSLSGYELERAVLDTMVPEPVAEGYRVVIHPKQDMLPTFLQGYQPDMVAYKDNKNLAIEIKAQSPVARVKERVLRERFAGHPDWELRFVYAPPINSDANIQAVSKQIVSEHLERLAASVDAMGLTAALLTGWAVFEAAARALLPSSLTRPQPPARLIETLASDGYVTPDEADMLRRLSRTRNEVAHGRLDLTPAREDVAYLIAIARSLLEPASEA